MTAIPAFLTRGMQGANKTLPRQWVRLNDSIPVMRDCFRATINIQLQAPLLILNPAITVAPFEWEPGHIEGFSFIGIEFEWPLDTPPVSHHPQITGRGYGHSTGSVLELAEGQTCECRES